MAWAGKVESGVEGSVSVASVPGDLSNPFFSDTVTPPFVEFTGSKSHVWERSAL